MLGRCALHSRPPKSLHRKTIRQAVELLLTHDVDDLCRPKCLQEAGEVRTESVLDAPLHVQRLAQDATSGDRLRALGAAAASSPTFSPQPLPTWQRSWPRAPTLAGGTGLPQPFPQAPGVGAG